MFLGALSLSLSLPFTSHQMLKYYKTLSARLQWHKNCRTQDDKNACEIYTSRGDISSLLQQLTDYVLIFNQTINNKSLLL